MQDTIFINWFSAKLIDTLLFCFLSNIVYYLFVRKIFFFYNNKKENLVSSDHESFLNNKQPTKKIDV